MTGPHTADKDDCHIKQDTLGLSSLYKQPLSAGSAAPVASESESISVTILSQRASARGSRDEQSFPGVWAGCRGTLARNCRLCPHQTTERELQLGLGSYRSFSPAFHLPQKKPKLDQLSWTSLGASERRARPSAQRLSCPSQGCGWELLFQMQMLCALCLRLLTRVCCRVMRWIRGVTITSLS